MNTVMESVLTICGTLIGTELLKRFCPKDQMVNFVGGLIGLSLLISGVGAVLSLDIDISPSEIQVQRQQEELTSYVDEQYSQAAQQDARQYVDGLLAAAGIEAKEILIFTDRNEDGSIVLTEVAVTLDSPSQEERGTVLLQNVLGEEIHVTVKSGG